MKKIIIELTEKEAAELIIVMGNGYGDGDFYQMNDSGGGDKRGYNRYRNIVDKIQKARGKF